MKLIGRFLSAILVLAWSASAFAQAPNFPLNSMVPNSAGGSFSSICGAGSATTQLLYNNGGACGGITGWTTNGTTTLTGGASTSIAIGGATIGSNALAVTGTATFSSAVTSTAANSYTVPQFQLGSASSAWGVGYHGSEAYKALFLAAGSIVGAFGPSGITTGVYYGFGGVNANAYFSSPAAASVQLGVVTGSGAAVAQTLSVQGSSGNSAAAALFTIAGSDQTGTTTTGGGVKIRGGNGTSAGGTVEIWTSATTTPAVAATFAANKNLTLTGQILITNIASDAAATDATACLDTTTQQLYKGTGTLGTCLGTSGRQFKTDFAPMSEGLAEISKLDLQRFRYRKGYGDDGARLQYGLMAQDVEKVLPDLAGHDADGVTINYDAGALLFVTMRAVQELKADNDNIRAELKRIAGQR